MRILIPALFLPMILVLLCGALQKILRRVLAERPALVFLAPLGLSLIFLEIAALLNALNWPLAALVVAYTLTPTGCCYLASTAPLRSRLGKALRVGKASADGSVREKAWSPAPGWVDFLVMLLLWLPLELAAGARWVAKPAQAPLHMAAYGISVVLGLILLLLFRRLDGVKYNLPRTGRDFWYALLGFAAVAPILIVLGRVLGFLAPFHIPARLSATRLVTQYLIILAATALPEEILFRGFIQNSLMQKLGPKTSTLLLAALIFGCAHLDNGPEPLPNWRYMILATIAGVAYGKVFEKSSSIFGSASLHALVNTIRHACF